MRSPSILAATFLLLGVHVHAVTFVIEPELFEYPGGWDQTIAPRAEAARKFEGEPVRKFLTAGPQAKGAPAVGGVAIPHAGQWHLWVRTKDFPQDRPGTRNFTVSIGGQRSPTLFGRHAREEFDGWSWEDGGWLELPAGPAMIALGEEVASTARCDALVLTDNKTYEPSGQPWKLMKEAATLVPLEISEESQRAYLPERLGAISDAAVATLENETVRFTWHRAGKSLALRAETRTTTGWEAQPGSSEAEGYRVLFRPADSDPKLSTARIYPTWDLAFSPFVNVRLGAQEIRTRLGINTALWSSAKCLPLRPIDATQRDAQTVELTFADQPAGKLTATWRLTASQPSAAIELHWQPTAPGFYSLGYHAPQAVAPDAADFLLLPFMYHGRRFPEQPSAILSALTPTPLALVNRAGVNCAVIAEPPDLSPDWPSSTNSRYAFSLRNETSLAQPLIYEPVLGTESSRTQKTGEPVTAHLRLWLQRGNWNDAYQRIAREVFALHDYRRPVTASLSDTALNLIDLMRTEEAAGWNAKAKGPWNIESRNTVSQSSPLTYLSLYLLTGDEDFYRRFALPSLEYLLSRPGPHFAAEREIWDNYYHHQPMRGPGPFFGASTFASAFTMTHGRSPVFGALCLDEKGEPRVMHGGGHTQTFADLLQIYHTTGDDSWLHRAVTAADQYLAANLTKLPTHDLGPQPFVNVSFVPDWEGLLHLYEATHEPRFLDAAREGARWLTTTLWTQPLVPEGDRTIHPGGLYDANRHIWWFGDKLFRRAVYEGPPSWDPPYPPPTPLPEKRVPAWTVSQVGLGLEQPSTYNRRGPQANILMSAWAPSLLRLAGEAKEDAFRTAARNAVIGRFANYPGYYLDGPTDAYQRPDYPLTGPDVTSLYVHHIPPFTAFVVDYLFTDAEMRSAGAVKFPSTRQCGYVWFDSRLYGHAPGHVYGDPAWPWLHRTAAKVDTINVDVLLAEGSGKFHVVLLNQVREPQRLRVSFDETVLGRPVEGAELSLHLDNEVAPPVRVKNGVAEVTLSPLGIATLTLDGVHIDVPTHRILPPTTTPLPKAPAQQIAPLGDTKLQAIGTVIEVPPFTWRDLYIYATASIDDARSATLRYRIGESPEQRLEKHEFPWEFTIRTEDRATPISWQLDLELTDGRHVSSHLSR
jgi:hypothetical protein